MRTCILSDMCSFVSLTKFISGWPNTLGSNFYGELTSHDEDLPWHVPFKICNSPLQCQTTSVVPRTFNRNGSGTTRTGECNWFVGDVIRRALQKAYCAIGITYWCKRAHFVNSNHHPEGRCGVRANSKYLVAQLETLFRYPPVCPARQKLQRVAQKLFQSFPSQTGLLLLP